MRVPNESLERDLIGGVGRMCQTKQESHGPKKLQTEQPTCNLVQRFRRVGGSRRSPLRVQSES